MNNTIHPSIDSLSAFVDNELPPGDIADIRAHVDGCPGCRDQVQAFSSLGEMARGLDEPLPGEAYWKDLPDRILARIAGAVVPRPVPEPQPSLWHRLWNPSGGWRLALGSAASLCLVAALWFVVHQTGTPWSPAAPEMAEQVATPVADDGSLYTPVDDAGRPQPTMNPNSYSKRVIMSLGGRDNLGTPLDILPGRAAGSGSGYSTIGSQVTNTLPPLSPDAAAVTNGVISYGCGENPIESAYLAALKAEESGNYHLASQGYRLVRASLPIGSNLRHEAEYRLMYLAWSERMQSTWTQRAKAIDELNQLASRSFQTWQQSQLDRDCTKAWCMNRVLLSLGPEVASPANLQQTSSRVQQLKDCAQE